MGTMEPITLPMVGGQENVAEELATFASPDRPLRPSRNAKFAGCPMSVILSMWTESAGNAAAQTGSLIHEAVKTFHQSQGDRVAAGLKALDQARAQFPEADEAKSIKIFRAYSADPENANAEVLWCEKQVTLCLAPAPEDPTGKPVVIVGTLDQVRRDRYGIPRVWDAKTGDRLSADETVNEYTIQMATYVLAARQSLDPTIEPGGFIYTPGYATTRGRKHLPTLTLTVDLCKLLVAPLVHWVAAVRRGITMFRPSAEACRFCDHAPWPKCVGEARRLFSLTTGV